VKLVIPAAVLLQRTSTSSLHHTSSQSLFSDKVIPEQRASRWATSNFKVFHPVQKNALELQKLQVTKGSEGMEQFSSVRVGQLDYFH
jgi:hypothetical protein